MLGSVESRMMCPPASGTERLLSANSHFQLRQSVHATRRRTIVRPLQFLELNFDASRIVVLEPTLLCRDLGPKLSV